MFPVHKGLSIKITWIGYGSFSWQLTKIQDYAPVKWVDKTLMRSVKEAATKELESEAGKQIVNLIWCNESSQVIYLRPINYTRVIFIQKVFFILSLI